MASTGGRITVLYSGPAAATVSIDVGSWTITGAGAATFPQALSAAVTEFVVAGDGTYTVTVAVLGVTVATYTVFLSGGNDLIFDATPSFDKLFSAVRPTTATTAQLAAIGNAVNTTGKYAGKMVYNTTTSKPVFAVGATAGSVWNDSAAALAHTPV